MESVNDWQHDQARRVTEKDESLGTRSIIHTTTCSRRSSRLTCAACATPYRGPKLSSRNRHPWCCLHRQWSQLVLSAQARQMKLMRTYKFLRRRCLCQCRSCEQRISSLLHDGRRTLCLLLSDGESSQQWLSEIEETAEAFVGKPTGMSRRGNQDGDAEAHG